MITGRQVLQIVSGIKDLQLISNLANKYINTETNIAFLSQIGTSSYYQVS